MTADEILRQQLLFLLRGGNAHLSFEQAVADFPMAHINSRAPNVPYTPWHLLEHIRLAQWDILDFIRSANYVAPPWPEGYWPASDAEADAGAWHKTIAQFQADLQTLQEIVSDPATNLTAPLPHAPKYNILREILLVADHNAYHIGEFAILRQVMQTWPAGS